MIDAIYFDGVSSRRHQVTMVIHKRVVSMRGTGVHRNERMSRMEISERFDNAPRILRFRDGAFIEATDHRRLDLMLKQNRFQEARVVRWQNNWPLSLAALILLVGGLLSTYHWGLPAAAEKIAARLPDSFGKKIGDEGFAAMEEQLLKPSALPAEQQQHLRERFAALVQPRGEKTAYQLEFRAGRMGANAFALPNGVIVITDDMVKLAGNDEAILGILSHELGHVQRRHSSRQLLESAGVGIMLNLWVGDVSSVLAAVPAILANMKHSRDFEREADRYAIDMMLANHIPLEPMAVVFETMSAKHDQKARAAATGVDEEGDDDEDGPTPPQPQDRREPPPDYLSSHPNDAERVATLRKAAAAAQTAGVVQ
ncbi:MAG: M48 family metallopeptidase [Massilia sp.]